MSFSYRVLYYLVPLLDRVINETIIKAVSSKQHQIKQYHLSRKYGDTLLGCRTNNEQPGNCEKESTREHIKQSLR